MIITARYIKEAEIEIDEKKYGGDINKIIRRDTPEDFDKCNQFWLDVAEQVCPNERGNNLRSINCDDDLTCPGLKYIYHKGKLILER